MQLTVALAAEEAAGVRAFQLLLDRGHRIAAVFTQSTGSRGVATVARRARRAGVPVRHAAEVRDPGTADWLRANDVHLLLNVHSLHIIDAAVLAAPRLGAYNLHPGPLPERAGLHAPSWALYEGSARHGVTLHRMTPTVDAGDVAFADGFAVGEADTGLTVMTQCVSRGMKLIERLLAIAECSRRIPEHRQDVSRRRWYGAGPPDGGHLDWGQTARRIVDFVRACDYRPFQSPWGFPRCKAGDLDLAVVRAALSAKNAAAAAGSVAGGNDRGVLVAATDAWVRVDEIEIDGRVVAAADVLAPGTRLG